MCVHDMARQGPQAGRRPPTQVGQRGVAHPQHVVACTQRPRQQHVRHRHRTVACERRVMQADIDILCCQALHVP